MAYDPPNLKHALDKGERLLFQPALLDEDGNVLEREQPGIRHLSHKTRGTLYACPGCGAWRKAFLLVDCRHFPSVPIDWACDGCRTSWERRGVAVDGGGPPANHKAWKRRWLKMLGAPKADIDKITSGAQPYGKHRGPMVETRRPVDWNDVESAKGGGKT